MKKILLSVITLSILLTGCTGPFVLTKKVHTWQTSFEDKWVDEVAFLGCIILPVYSLSTLADGLIFNSVEFWTGENPMDSVEAPSGNEMCLRSVAAQM
ncbi:DUF3332 family protein [Tichowtungia aerotolerans]|uniref:DUF3332 family protein n=1 Tax=Tichowtungia aerotolerans TaxID=2697043 RepID=A0A6P1M8U2_9BACT|nr:DUF3332 family protein [Tichowtungia aerotolerans]QHI70442.1 DUF3332 family protein [Tichowtungia aerotolerans]